MTEIELKKLIREEVEKKLINEGIGKTLTKGALATTLAFSAPKYAQSQTNNFLNFNKKPKTTQNIEKDAQKIDFKNLESGFVDEKDSTAIDFGISPDLATAKKMALMKAKTRLAKHLNKEKLENFKIINEKLFLEENGNYKYWVQIKEN